MSKNEGKQKKSKSQKIVIPKGAIDPNQETVIEIPPQMRRRPVVVAKKDASTVGVLKRRQTDKSTVVFRDQSTITPKQTREGYQSYGSQDPGSSRGPIRQSQYPSQGLSHSSHVDFADENDIEQLLDDLERYYCFQRQLLVKAKLSRMSTCSCSSKQRMGCHACLQTTSPTDIRLPTDNVVYTACPEDERRSKTKRSCIDSDSSAYDRFKGGLKNDYTSEQIYNVPKTGIVPQETRSAPQSQALLKTDSYEPKYRDQTEQYRSSALPLHNSSSSIARQDRNYEKLLNSKKLFAYHAEILRKKLNELEPESFPSKKSFKETSEVLRIKLKKLYDAENDLLTDDEIENYIIDLSVPQADYPDPEDNDKFIDLSVLQEYPKNDNIIDSSDYPDRSENNNNFIDLSILQDYPREFIRDEEVVQEYPRNDNIIDLSVLQDYPDRPETNNTFIDLSVLQNYPRDEEGLQDYPRDLSVLRLYPRNP